MLCSDWWYSCYTCVLTWPEHDQRTQIVSPSKIYLTNNQTDHMALSLFFLCFYILALQSPFINRYYGKAHKVLWLQREVQVLVLYQIAWGADFPHFASLVRVFELSWNYKPANSHIKGSLEFESKRDVKLIPHNEPFYV